MFETKIKLKQGCSLDLMNGIVIWDRDRLETLRCALLRKEFVDRLTDEEVILINEKCLI
jgi:hypothetical protein